MYLFRSKPVSVLRGVNKPNNPVCQGSTEHSLHSDARRKVEIQDESEWKRFRTPGLFTSSTTHSQRTEGLLGRILDTSEKFFVRFRSVFSSDLANDLRQDAFDMQNFFQSGFAPERKAD
jgi:hypothetical protein